MRSVPTPSLNLVDPAVPFVTASKRPQAQGWVSAVQEMAWRTKLGGLYAAGFAFAAIIGTVSPARSVTIVHHRVRQSRATVIESCLFPKQWPDSQDDIKHGPITTIMAARRTVSAFRSRAVDYLRALQQPCGFGVLQ